MCDTTAILGTNELSDKGKLTVVRTHKIQRSLFQPSYAAKAFISPPGKYVILRGTIVGFKAVLNDGYDHLPEQAFYIIGSIEEAVGKAKILN